MGSWAAQATGPLVRRGAPEGMVWDLLGLPPGTYAPRERESALGVTRVEEVLQEEEWLTLIQHEVCASRVLRA